VVVLEDEAAEDPSAEAAAAADALEVSPEAAAVVAEAGFLAAEAAEVWGLLAEAAAIAEGLLDRCFFQTLSDAEKQMMAGHLAEVLQVAGSLVPAAVAAVAAL